MRNTRRRTLWAGLGIALALAAHPAANAQTLIFTLQNPIPTAMPGGTFQFVATLRNSSTVNALTLSDVFSSNSANGTITTEYFNTGEVPGTLGPVGSSDPNAPNTYTGRLFDLQVSPTAAAGDSVTGSYSIDYQVNGGSIQTATQNFALKVTGVPEPSSIALLAAMGTAGGLLLRRRPFRA